MDALQHHWRRALRGALHKSPTFTEGGLLLGYGTVLVHRSGGGFELDADAERCLCLLSIAQRRPQSMAVLHYLRRALASWERGDEALAHIHLAFGQLPKIGSLEDGLRLHQAEALIDRGMAPRTLAKELGVDLGLLPMSRAFNPAEPRNPKNSGVVSGEWTKDLVASGSIAFAAVSIPASAKEPVVSPTPTQGPTTALMPTPAVPSLVDALGAEALQWLKQLVGRLALPAAVFGAVFVPSPSSGTFEQGAVPGRPGMSYRLDRDTGTLRLSLDADPNPDHALVALLGADGIYRDVDTKVAIARAVGSEAVIIDLDLAPDAFDGRAPRPGVPPDEPKLCPDPSKDQQGGRRLFDILYEQWVRDWVNPQRKPQLPPWMAFALPADTPSGWVHYDDCREATGGMIEAKGNFTEMLSSFPGRMWLEASWLEQADRQIKGAAGRTIDWYFHDPAAADLARLAFEEAGIADRIGIHVLPYLGGVPKYNPRVRR